METQVELVFEPPAARLGLSFVLPAFSTQSLDLRPLVRRAAAGSRVAFRADAGPLAWYREGLAIDGGSSRLELELPEAPGSVAIDCLCTAGGSARDARARAIASCGYSLAPLSWAETVARNDAPLDSAAYAKGLGDCRDLAWSPDGLFLAAAGRESNAITLFEAGEPGAVFALSSLGGAGEPRLLAPSRLAFATGEVLLALSEGPGALYAISCSQGALALIGFRNDPALAGAADFAAAPCSQGAALEVYVAAAGADAVARVRLAPGGMPGAVDIAAAKDSGSLASFSRPSCIALEPSGRLLAVGTSGDDALYLFARDPASGGLALSERIDKSAIASLASLSDPCSLAFSADGASLFVLSYYGKALIRLDRVPETGRFVARAAAKSGSDGVSGFLYPKRLAFSPGGGLVAVAGGGAADGIALFSPAAGGLVFLGATPPGGGDAFLGRPSCLAISPSGASLAAANDGRLALYRLSPAQ
jgi:WD40 repeat protein